MHAKELSESEDATIAYHVWTRILELDIGTTKNEFRACDLTPGGSKKTELSIFDALDVDVVRLWQIPAKPAPGGYGMDISIDGSMDGSINDRWMGP